VVSVSVEPDFLTFCVERLLEIWERIPYRGETSEDETRVLKHLVGGLHDDMTDLVYALSDPSAERNWEERIWQAMMLTPRLELAEKLLRGEDVPVELLDQEWARRFGMIV
jgi:hypothetical protein